MKTCSTCGIRKELTEFRVYKKQSRVGGQCKACLHEKEKEYYYKNKDLLKQKREERVLQNQRKSGLVQISEKRCNHCRKSKTVKYFHKSKRTTDGYSPTCKICRSKFCKKYREKNLEQLKAKRRLNYATKTRERERAVSKVYYEKNKEKKSSYTKQWWARNKEKIFQYSKKHYQLNKIKTLKRLHKDREALNEKYIKRLLRQCGFDKDMLSNSDLIEIKRLQTKIARHVKKKTTGKKS